MKKVLSASAHLFVLQMSFACIFSCAPSLGVAQVLSSSVATVGLENYASCHFEDGLQVVAVDPFAPGVKARTVPTGSGEKRIDMLAGYRIMFAYPNTDFFANAKAEKLPAETYKEEKAVLLENYRYLLSESPNDYENTSLVSPMVGLELHGFDRKKLEGGVLGLYLLFDDRVHIALTIYVLNQEPSVRKFQTMDEYAKLRDQYLRSYARCIQINELIHSMTQ